MNETTKSTRKPFCMDSSATMSKSMNPQKSPINTNITALSNNDNDSVHNDGSSDNGRSDDGNGSSNDRNDSISTSMTESCGPLPQIKLMIISLQHMTGSSQ